MVLNFRGLSGFAIGGGADVVSAGIKLDLPP